MILIIIHKLSDHSDHSALFRNLAGPSATVHPKDKFNWTYTNQLWIGSTYSYFDGGRDEGVFEQGRIIAFISKLNSNFYGFITNVKRDYLVLVSILCPPVTAL